MHKVVEISQLYIRVNKTKIGLVVFAVIYQNSQNRFPPPSKTEPHPSLE